MTQGIRERRAGAWKVGCLALSLCLGAPPLAASAQRSLDGLKHALGWDTMNLTTVEKDGAQRATLERGDNAANRVERRTSYHANGRKAQETVSVTSRGAGKVLYLGKKAWLDSGDPDSVAIEDDVFGDGGRQLKGFTVEQRYKSGRLIREDKRRYSAKAKGWASAYTCAISYYEDGDMKERVTVEPLAREKTRETWGSKEGSAARKLSTQNWDWTKSEWI